MMERSKLPVLRAQTLKSSDPSLPSAKKPCPQKPVLPLYSKDPNIAFSSTVPDFTMNKGVNNGKKTLLSKRTVPIARGPATRYRVESELRDQNQLLEAANQTLHNRLCCAQNTIQEMSDNRENMQEELNELRQRLEKHVIILEGRNIDPVSGEKILADAEETSKIRAATKTATENLLKEVKLLSATAKEQKKLVQTIKSKWKEAEESRNLFLEEQNAFQDDLENFKLSLEQAEQWLDL